MLSLLSSEWQRDPRKAARPLGGDHLAALGVMLQHGRRRHRTEVGLELVCLPGQAGVPEDSDTLDDGQPVMKGTR